MTLFSLAWRLTLVAALVLNPVLSAAAGMADGAPAAAGHAGDRAPPCHGMAMESVGKPPATPLKPHRDCGTACHGMACCATGVFDLSAPWQAPLVLIGQPPMPSLDHRRPESPPAARMIRPPIA